MRRSSVQLTVGLVAVALLAAACGSSGSSSTRPTAGSTSHSAAAATGGSSGNDIVVGGLTDGSLAGIDTGFKARIARFNAGGGLAGRKIKFIGVLNDGDSLSTDLSNAQTLVLKDHVFAVAPIADVVLNPSSTQLFAQNSTPFIGWGVSPSFCDNNWGFPIAGCEASARWQSTWGYAEAAQAMGRSPKGLKVAVIGIDNAGGKAGTVGIVAAVKKAGGEVVYGQAPVPQDGTTDYTPYVQAILAGHPDMVQLVLTFTSAVGLTAALRQAGYTGALWNPTAYVPGLLASQPQLAQALTGSLVVANFPPAEDGSAAARQVQADLKAMGAPTNFSLGEAVGWWSGEELIQELQATAAKGAVTQANFEKVINAGWTISPVAGGIEDLTFPTDHVKAPGCYGTLQAEGTRYLDKVRYTCEPSAEINVSGG
jgi:ABC-type branched-subunit amino acid transport system substrate-binding protein